MTNTHPTFTDFGLGKQRLSQVRGGILAKLFALPAYHWLLLASLAAIFPHVLGLPTPLLVVALFTIIMQKPSIKCWINRHSHQKMTMIYKLLKSVVFFGGALTLWISFGKTFGVDVAVCFLVLCFVTKLWELQQQRDAYVALNLALFVVASAFLLNQGLGVTLLVLPSFLAILMAFVVLNDPQNHTGAGRVRALMMLALPAVPLLVMLFVFFPRIPPIWSLPMAAKSATTGVSDSMSPGDFSNLSQSTELAFRVEFQAQRPKRQEMYWRGLVLSDFDGITWRQNESKSHFWSQTQAMPHWTNDVYQGMSYEYQVILEPTEQHWLFALDYPKPDLRTDMSMNDDFTLRALMPISQQKRYRVSAYPNAQIEQVLQDASKHVNTQLPKSGNQKSKAFAQSLFEQSQFDPVRYIQLVQHYISTQGFGYTLSPPLLHDNRIDEFLFESKSGFCEHYASSFTFLMRAVGIPARVVVGYQGGELGRDGTSWEVRQMDAHAWSEVWLAGQGWVRIDPTAFVSPQRIDNGMSATTQATGASMFGDGVVGQWSYQQFKLLQTLRRYSDQVSYYWQRDIVGFDQDKQKHSLFKWLNINNFAQQVWAMLGAVVAVVLTFLMVAMYKRKKRHHALDLPLIKLSKRLGKAYPELVKSPSEPYLSWLDRVGEQLNKPVPISELKVIYRQCRYGRTDWNKDTIRYMTELGKQL